MVKQGGAWDPITWTTDYGAIIFLLSPGSILGKFGPVCSNRAAASPVLHSLFVFKAISKELTFHPTYDVSNEAVDQDHGR